MNEKTKAYLAALSFSAIIGFSFLFTKIALSYASPLTNLAHRYTIAALVLVILHQTKLINVSLSRKDILSILTSSCPNFYTPFSIGLSQGKDKLASKVLFNFIRSRSSFHLP